MRVLLLSLIFLISACSTLSEQECISERWYDVGYRDGQKGALRTIFNDHVKSCRRFNVQLSLIDYDMGRERGLIDYCTSAAVGIDVHRKMICQRTIDAENLGVSGVVNRSIIDLNSEINSIIKQGIPRL